MLGRLTSAKTKAREGGKIVLILFAIRQFQMNPPKRSLNGRENIVSWGGNPYSLCHLWVAAVFSTPLSVLKRGTKFFRKRSVAGTAAVGAARTQRTVHPLHQALRHGTQ